MKPEIIDRGRGPEIKGTRITVYDIIDYWRANWHHTAIASLLGLSSDQVLLAIQYIQDHADEVLPKHDRDVARAIAGNPPEIEQRRKHSRALLRAKIAEIAARNGN